MRELEHAPAVSDFFTTSVIFKVVVFHHFISYIIVVQIGLKYTPDIVTFRYEVSDIALNMARLQLIGIVSRPQCHEYVFCFKKNSKLSKL